MSALAPAAAGTSFAADAGKHVLLFAAIDVGFHLWLGFTDGGASFLFWMAEELGLSGGLHGAEAMAHAGHAHGAAGSAFAQAAATGHDAGIAMGAAGFDECLAAGGSTHMHGSDLVCHP